MAKSRSYKKKNNKLSRKPKHLGGNASDWVEQVVGKYPHHAQGGNVIQQNVPSINMKGGMAPPAPPMAPMAPVAPVAPVAPMAPAPSAPPVFSGGNKGGNVLSEIAVPAVLLIANQTFGKKTGKKYSYSNRRSKNKRFSRRRR